MKEEQTWTRSIALVTARKHNAILASCCDLLGGLSADFDNSINQAAIDIPNLLLQTRCDLIMSKQTHFRAGLKFASAFRLIAALKNDDPRLPLNKITTERSNLNTGAIDM